MSVTQKALWIIERNLRRDLTLDEIARSCGVTKFHLAHAFGQSTEQSLMHYVRGRRLSEAARDLASGAPDILHVALDAGYSSHEAFTRAFSARFHATPEIVRDRGTIAGLALTQPMKSPASSRPAPSTPRILLSPNIRVVGLAAHHAFGATEGIPGQWQRFMTNFSEIPNRLPRIPIGVATTIDADGEFEYLCGVEVSAFNGKPAGLTQLDIAARTYAVFEHNDHVSTLPQTYAAIWDRALTDNQIVGDDAPSIERHKETFDTRTGYGGVEIWIPIKERSAEG